MGRITRTKRKQSSNTRLAADILRNTKRVAFLTRLIESHRDALVEAQRKIAIAAQRYDEGNFWEADAFSHEVRKILDAVHPRK